MLSRFSCVQLFAILWTVACQAPLSWDSPRQENWSGLPCPAPGDLPNPGIELTSLTSPALANRFFTTSATWEAPLNNILLSINNTQIKEEVSTEILKMSKIQHQNLWDAANSCDLLYYDICFITMVWNWTCDVSYVNVCKWRYSLHSWIRKLTIVKILVLPNLIYKFNSHYTKITSNLVDYWQTASKVYMERQKTQNGQHSIKEKQQSHRTDTQLL